MGKILLKEVQILSKDGVAVTTDIAITDTKITAIGTVPVGWNADKVIDGKNKLAIPGFVNAHTHAAMTLLRSYGDDLPLMDWLEKKMWPAEAKLNAKDVYWGSMLAIAEMLKAGITCFADMYFFMEEVAKATAESGIRASLARGLVGVSPTGQQSLEEAESFYRNWHHGAEGRITVMLGPHAPYTCPPQYLQKVINIAANLGAEIHIHLSETKDEVENCQKEYGKSPIALMEEIGLLDLGVLAAHCVHVSAADIAIMQAKKVRVAHNPGSNMKLASGVAPVPDMFAAGLCVSLGTDGAASNNNLDMLEEMRLTALLHKAHNLKPLAVPAAQALSMATEQGAMALGLSKEIGKLQPGYQADIVLLDMQAPHWHPCHNAGSLLVYAAQASDVHTVLVNGKVLLDNRQLTTIDLEKVIAEAERSAFRIVAQESAQ